MSLHRIAKDSTKLQPTRAGAMWYNCRCKHPRLAQTQMKQMDRSEVNSQPMAERQAATNRATLPSIAPGSRRRWLMVGLYMLVDTGLIVLALFVAYYLRYVLRVGQDIAASSNVAFRDFLLTGVALVVACLFSFQWRGLYRLPRGSSWLDALAIIFSSTLTAIAVVILASLLFQPVLLSRLVYFYFWLTAVVLLSVARFLAGRLRVALWRRGIDVRRVIVAGSGRAGQRIMKDIVERPELGYKLVGYVEDEPDEKLWAIPISRQHQEAIQHLGPISQVAAEVQRTGAHEVIIALPASAHEASLSVVELCRRSKVSFRLVPDLFEMSFNQVQINDIAGVPLIGVREPSLQGFNLAIKRAMDLLLTPLLLLLLSPIFLIVALLVKFTSPGPIFFAQQRIGKDGRSFKFYKFRSMYIDAEARKPELLAFSDREGLAFKKKDDPRRTPVGCFIRKTSIDELPQFLNVLRGEMSLVGPRPPIPQEVAVYDEWARQRLSITPGVTGLWQVSGRSDLSFEEMVKLDLYYAENWSPLFDLKIMIRTVPAIIRGEGAY